MAYRAPKHRKPEPDDRPTNTGRYDGEQEEDGTSAERMAAFDKLPKVLRRFLADAPFDFAVMPFVHSPITHASYLNFTAQQMTQTEVRKAYGLDHPQAKHVGALTLIPRKKKHERTRGKEPDRVRAGAGARGRRGQVR